VQAFKSKSTRKKMKEAVNVKGSQGAGLVAADLEAKLEDRKPVEEAKAFAKAPPLSRKGKKGKKK
jgi:hypothetical protein